MKIRHKQSGVVLEGEFCCCGEMTGDGKAKHYFAAHRGQSTYDASEWEEVKPEWVDVTGECEMNRAGNVILWKGNDWVCKLYDDSGYRLRKVEAVMSGYPHPYYFIIEKRQA